MDNVFIERLWRSLKYEDIYLKDYATVAALEQGVDHWMRATTPGVRIRGWAAALRRRYTGRSKTA